MLQQIILSCCAVLFVSHITFAQEGTATYATCDSGWDLFNGRCYFVSEDKKNWRTAKDDCELRGSDLITVNGPVENVWLQTLMKDNEFFFIADILYKLENRPNENLDFMWMGANDIRREGQFKWVSNGQGLVFTDWYRREPNNAGPNKNEDCIHMKKRSGGKTEYKWNDVSCADSNHYICEK